MKITKKQWIWGAVITVGLIAIWQREKIVAMFKGGSVPPTTNIGADVKSPTV